MSDLTGRDTETLAEVRCPDCPHGIKWHHDERGCQYHGNGPHACPCGLSIDAGIAARIEQARAGEDALRHECGTGPLRDGWPFGVDDAYRTIAAVSWPAERKESRDGWAVTMRHRADLFEQEARRACERLEAAITHGRAALTDTAGDDRGECGDYPAPCNHDPAHLGAGEGR